MQVASLSLIPRRREGATCICICDLRAQVQDTDKGVKPDEDHVEITLRSRGDQVEIPWRSHGVPVEITWKSALDFSWKVM